MLVSLGVLTQHPTVNLVREMSGSYLISHMPPKFDLSLQQKAGGLLPPATCTGPEG